MSKSILFLLCIPALIAPATLAARDALSLEIAIPKTGEARVISAGPGYHFHVLLKNCSKQPQRIWDERFSFGYFSLSFLLTDSSGSHWVARKKDRGWTMNAPEFLKLDPGETLVLDVYPADTDTWEGFPLPTRYRTNVMMRAAFEVPHDKYTKQYSVWTGKISSPEKPFVFRPASPMLHSAGRGGGEALQKGRVSQQ